MTLDQRTDAFLANAAAVGMDAASMEHVRDDDLGPHFVYWIDDTKTNGIFFYIDYINVTIVVESLGTMP